MSAALSAVGRFLKFSRFSCGAIRLAIVPYELCAAGVFERLHSADNATLIRPTWAKLVSPTIVVWVISYVNWFWKSWVWLANFAPYIYKRLTNKWVLRVVNVGAMLPMIVCCAVVSLIKVEHMPVFMWAGIEKMYSYEFSVFEYLVYFCDSLNGFAM